MKYKYKPNNWDLMYKLLNNDSINLDEIDLSLLEENIHDSNNNIIRKNWKNYHNLYKKVKLELFNDYFNEPIPFILDEIRNLFSYNHPIHLDINNLYQPISNMFSFNEEIYIHIKDKNDRHTSGIAKNMKIDLSKLNFKLDYETNEHILKIIPFNNCYLYNDLDINKLDKKIIIMSIIPKKFTYIFDNTIYMQEIKKIPEVFFYYFYAKYFLYKENIFPSFIENEIKEYVYTLENKYRDLL